MDAFKTHKTVIDNYRSYLTSFLSIQDERIKKAVSGALNDDGFLPEPLIQFNPEFETGNQLSDLVAEGRVHSGLPKIFGDYNLYKHQIDAIDKGINGEGFVVTSGTGSGKSLTYLATIFNDLLQRGGDKPKGVKAILVYPMNALINSQEEEIRKYEDGCNENGLDFPITYARYTGQEGGDERERIKTEEPDIILTNYMMLELIMTRHQESWMRDSLSNNLKYLVFDELHTYRGRQGSDVSMLIRRVRGLAKNRIICIGTSATMMSGGTPEEKKQSVAEVAETIFGDHYPIDNIIGESLRACTNGVNPSKEELASAIRDGIKPFENESDFKSHPLTNWLELNIALRNNSGHLERSKPLSISEITDRLNEVVDLDREMVKDAITRLLIATEKFNEDNRGKGSRRSFLPFRFHQFVSQTSIVSVTLDTRENREISIQPGRYVKTDEGEKLLYPLLFSRISGYDFICVEKDVEASKLMPRNPDDGFDTLRKKDGKKENLVEQNFRFGYIVLDEGEEFWEESFIDILPENWLASGGERVQAYYDWFMPKRIYFDSSGNYSDKEDGSYPFKGYFLAAKLKIDPTAGVIHDDSRVGEYTKLMKLGNEGRSTATTVISYSIIDALHRQGVKVKDQKLLSFTDNRQDASLQAGHFNDFLATVRLRSAMYKALLANPEGLDVNNIAERIYEVLKLDESQFATNPSSDPHFPEEQNLRALKQYLLLRIFQDLKRGWRYTLPNLEQTALLRIKYHRLEELAFLDERFESIPFLQVMEAEEREQTLIQILNYFRTNFAIDHRILLSDRGEVENLMRNRLDENKLWSLDKRERIDAPKYMTIFNPGRTQRGIYTGSIGPQSGLGKFIKRKYADKGLTIPDRDTLREVIGNLCEALVGPGLLKKQEGIKGTNSGDEGVTGYLLRSDCIKWLPGDEITVAHDETRIVAYRELESKPNPFFQNLYKSDFTDYKKEIEGREHTGQLSSEDRIEREENFRKGQISSLFCSPTMELGIDIANLNVVHMRNVPPNPANYAQRGGRAGRSGQTALVFTYCSSYSPHDQNYFKAADTMVAGQVVPPKIDLSNEELIRTHLHAFLLMNLALKELHTSVVSIVDLEKLPELPLINSVRDQIKHNIDSYGDAWTEQFRKYIEALEPELLNTWWYNQDKLKSFTKKFLDRFDAALDRWRKLYLSAKDLINEAHRINNDPTIKDKEIKREAKRQYSVGMRQKELLENDSASKYGNSSEFYIFRYLASEGFIPGYNFTRLPVRSFVGFKHMDQGEYISRPRFVALREFGPGNIIYHNGNKYAIKRMMLTDADALQRKIKISKETGYAFLDADASLANNDPITQTELKGENAEYRSKLIEVGESEAIPQMRISCQEEERLSTGFQIESYFRYPNGIERTVKSIIKRGEEPLLQMIYAPATELIQLNRKWKKSQDEGYSIDKRNGKWLSQKDLENDETSENERKVMVFARDTADTLYIQPLEALGLSPEELISLSYALKRGIEVQYQVEESEIGVEIVGDPESPNILIYESAQGSLGILSVLASEPMALKELFKTTYSCMHFDPETRTETELGESLPKATYRDLLSYYNQRHHDKLDRHSIQEALETLMDCSVEKEQGGNDRETQMEMLKEQYDKSSSTELKLLKYLYDNCLALPDRAQVNVPEFYISADFVYNSSSGPVLVFCDGSVHDHAGVKEDDSHKRDLLRSQGYDVIEWHYMEPISELVSRRKDVFRKVC
jgi:superfamily II DNA/RNA helicase